MEHGKKITRNTRVFPYPWHNGKRWWMPDFIIEGKFTEVKGVMDYKSAKKIGSFAHEVDIIGKDEIAPYLQYAESKYGKDFADKIYDKGRR